MRIPRFLRRGQYWFAFPACRTVMDGLRHSFASRALALREGLPMIGKLLGHTLVQTTARYAHLAHDTVKASAARIGDSIKQDLHVSEVLRRSVDGT